MPYLSEYAIYTDKREDPTKCVEDDQLAAIKNALVEASGEKWSVGDPFNVENATWYEWKEDLVEISKQFPDVVFRSYRYGQDNEASEIDQEFGLFINGKSKVVMAEAVFPDISIEEVEKA